MFRHRILHDLHRTRSAAEKYHAVKQDYISDSQVKKGVQARAMRL